LRWSGLCLAHRAIGDKPTVVWVWAWRLFLILTGVGWDRLIAGSWGSFKPAVSR